MYRAEGSSKSSHKYCQRLKRALNARSLILEKLPAMEEELISSNPITSFKRRYLRKYKDENTSEAR